MSTPLDSALLFTASICYVAFDPLHLFDSHLISPFKTESIAVIDHSRIEYGSKARNTVASDKNPTIREPRGH